jgi:rSAM/selenodomain-associated transferase 1
MPDHTLPPLRVALMAKAPVPGLAKTRLAPALGAAGAAALAEALLRHAVAQASAAAPGRVTLWAAPDAGHPVFAALAQQHGLALAVQPATPDLGARMAAVFKAGFAAGPGPLLLMGSDIPALDAATLQAAAWALQAHPVVFVPALDGGYALVGLHHDATGRHPGLLAALFEGMVWSTATVMADTRARLAALGVVAAELPAVPDIDEPADLAHLPPALAAAAVPR